MAKFAMYVVHFNEDGEPKVFGSNDADEVRDYLEARPDDPHVVIHSTYGDWQTLGEDAAVSIEGLPTDEEEDED